MLCACSRGHAATLDNPSTRCAQRYEHIGSIPQRPRGRAGEARPAAGRPPQRVPSRPGAPRIHLRICTHIRLRASSSNSNSNSRGQGNCGTAPRTSSAGLRDWPRNRPRNCGAGRGTGPGTAELPARNRPWDHRRLTGKESCRLFATSAAATRTRPPFC